MNYVKILIAALIGSLTNFFGGWVIYGMLLQDTMEKSLSPEGAAVYRKEPLLGGIFVSGFLFSLLLAYAAEKSTTRGAAAGASMGAVFGLLLAASIDISYYSMTTMYSGMSIFYIDMAANTVLSALIGSSVGWYLGYKRAAA